MIETTSTLVDLTRPLIAQFNSFCTENNLVGLVRADSVCIKCSSSVIYEARIKDSEAICNAIHPFLQDDQRACVADLKQALETVAGDIAYLELFDQKADNSQIDCIGHISMVPTTSSCEDIVKQLEEKGIEVIADESSYQIKLPSGFTVKLTAQSLAEKVK